MHNCAVQNGNSPLSLLVNTKAKDIARIREEFGILLARQMDGEYLTADELRTLISQLNDTLERMESMAASQVQVRTSHFQVYANELHSRVQFADALPFINHIAGVTRMSKAPRYSGVYFAVSDGRPDVIKIGYSDDIYERMKFRNWHTIAIIQCDTPLSVEQILHGYFGEYGLGNELFHRDPVMRWLNEAQS